MATVLIKRLQKFIGGSVLFFLLVSATYIGYSWKYEEGRAMRSIDARLLLATKTLPLLLAPDFHDRALSADSISFEEEMLNRGRVNAFVEAAGILYAQTLVRHEDGFYFSSPTVKEDEASERESWYFYPYEDIPEEFRRAYETGETVFLSYSDRWGTFRSVCSPALSPEGRTYLVLADFDIASMRTLLFRVGLCSLGVIFLSFWPYSPSFAV